MILRSTEQFMVPCQIVPEDNRIESALYVSPSSMLGMSTAATVFLFSLAVLCVNGYNAEHEALRMESEVNAQYNAILQEVRSLKEETTELKERSRQQQLEITEIKVQSVVYIQLNVLRNITYNMYHTVTLLGS